MVHRWVRIIVIIGVLATTSIMGEHSLFAAGYKLALNEEAAVCKKMLELSNAGLLKTRSLEDPDSRPSAEGVMFIQWKALDNLSEELAYRTDSLHSAIIDIDNDGQLDWVVKIDHFISSLQSEELVFFRNHTEPPKFQAGITIEELHRADGSLNFTGNEYLLKKIPKHRFKDGSSVFHSIGGGAFLVPFRFQNNTYVLIANPFQEIFLENRRFAIVAKFLANVGLKDVCYVERITSQPKKR